jgi:hypothetical protein
MSAQSSLVTGASFVTRPPSGTPTAFATNGAAGFPVAGDTYAVLSTGGTDNLFGNPAIILSSDNGGGTVRGTTDRDVTILKIDVRVPSYANCLTFDARFLSEEFPEFPGVIYNDSLVAELDINDWTTRGPRLIAPHDFAFRTNGQATNIRTTGDTSASASNATDTRFDGATPLLRVSTPAAPGDHSLYITILDQGDSAYDSAAFLDRLVAQRTRQGECRVGAFPSVKPAVRSLAPRSFRGNVRQYRAQVVSESSVKRAFVRLDGRLVSRLSDIPSGRRNFVLPVTVGLDRLAPGRHTLSFQAVNVAGSTTTTQVINVG